MDSYEHRVEGNAGGGNGQRKGGWRRGTEGGKEEEEKEEDEKRQQRHLRGPQLRPAVQATGLVCEAPCLSPSISKKACTRAYNILPKVWDSDGQHDASTFTMFPGWQKRFAPRPKGASGDRGAVGRW